MLKLKMNSIINNLDNYILQQLQKIIKQINTTSLCFFLIHQVNLMLLLIKLMIIYKYILKYIYLVLMGY